MSTLHFLFFKTGPRHVRNLREAASYLCKQPRCNIDLRDNEGETPLLVACLRKECVLNELRKSEVIIYSTARLITMAVLDVV